jgi:tetratricopeptide (TPR) repeat protein
MPTVQRHVIKLEDHPGLHLHAHLSTRASLGNVRRRSCRCAKPARSVLFHILAGGSSQIISRDSEDKSWGMRNTGCGGAAGEAASDAGGSHLRWEGSANMISQNADRSMGRMALTGQLWVSAVGRNFLPFLISLIVLTAFHVSTWSYAIIGVSLFGGAAFWAAGLAYRSPTTDLATRPRGAIIARKHSLASNLPPLGLFVGREDETRTAADFLMRQPADGPRAVVLFGAPGVGTTALALYIARRVSQRYPDGQVFVRSGDLHLVPGGRATPSIGALVETLTDGGAALTPSQTEPGARLAELTSGRRILFVIDDVCDVGDMQFFLDSCPSCGFVVTSRTRLEIPGAVLNCSVEPLSEQDATELLGKLIGHERVEREELAARRIVSSAAGRPLALHLLAATLTSEPYAGLGFAVDRLEGPNGEAEGLFTAFDLMLLSLTDEERDALAMLGLLDKAVFATWELQALLGADDTAVGRIIDNLVRACLLEQLNIDAAEPSQFRVHDMVRAYAKSLVEREVTVDERASRRVALTQAGSRRRFGHLLLTAEAEVFGLLEAGELAAAVECARDAVSIGREARNRGQEAIALTALAHVQCELGNLQEAQELALVALDLNVKNANRRARRCLSKVHWRKRQFAAAAEELRRASAVADDGDGAETLREMRDLAVLQADTGEAAAAMATLEHAAKRYRSVEDTALSVDLDLAEARGHALRKVGRWPEAEADLLHALRGFEEAGQGLRSAWLEYELGLCKFERGDLEGAEKHAVNSISAFARMKHRYGVSHSRLLLGRIFIAERRDFDASAVLAVALMSVQNCGDIWMQAEVSRVVAGVRSRENRTVDANRLYNQAASTFADLADTSSLALVYREWNEGTRQGVKHWAGRLRHRLRSA